jgi:hypothetical protein
MYSGVPQKADKMVSDMIGKSMSEDALLVFSVSDIFSLQRPKTRLADLFDWAIGPIMLTEIAQGNMSCII